MAEVGILVRRDTKAKLEDKPPLVGEIVYAIDTNEHGWLDLKGQLKWGNFSSIDKPIIVRSLKEYFIENPPIDGYMVYATDTGEHGWLDKDNNLVWKKLDTKFASEAKYISIDTTNLNDFYKDTYIETIQDFIDRTQEIEKEPIEATRIHLTTDKFSRNLSPYDDTLQKLAETVDEFILGEKNEIINSLVFHKNLNTDDNTINKALVTIDNLELGEKNETFNTILFNKNLSPDDDNLQKIFNKIDEFDLGYSPTGLELYMVNDNNSYRLKSENKLLFAELGEYSIDLTITTDTTIDKGAKGNKSIAIGADAAAKVNDSIAIGTSSIANGSGSLACIGASTFGVGSVAIGYSAKTLGNYSYAFGTNVNTIKDNSFVIGRYNEASPDNIFEVGDGLNVLEKKNVFSVATDGTAKINTTIDKIINDNHLINLEFFKYWTSKGAGIDNITNNDNSTSFGLGNITPEDNSFVIGTYNTPNVDSIFEIGIGTNAESRINALEVKKDGSILAPQLELDLIIEDKSLITKEYYLENLNLKEQGLIKFNDSYIIDNKNIDYYGELGVNSYTFNESNTGGQGALGLNSLSQGFNTYTLRDNSVSLGIYNNPNIDHLFTIGNGNESLRSNALEIYEDGRIIAPTLTNESINDPKSLITKEYLETNTSTTANNIIVDSSNFNGNLTNEDIDVQTALNTIDALSISLRDDMNYIDRTLEYANILNITYDGTDIIRTDYEDNGTLYYLIYNYQDDMLESSKYYLTETDTLILTISYVYENNKLISRTRS